MMSKAADQTKINLKQKQTIWKGIEKEEEEEENLAWIMSKVADRKISLKQKQTIWKGFKAMQSNSNTD